MFRNQPYNRDRVRERRNARDSPEAGLSGIGQVLTRSAQKTQNMSVSLGDSRDSSSDTSTDTPIKIDCDCIVGQLKKISFRKRDWIDQLQILCHGRPMPSLNLLLANVPEDLDQFYQFCDWICGCDKYKRLFCWPCLLFNETFNGWDLLPIHEIGHLIKIKVSHESSPSHFSSLVNFTVFRTDAASSNENCLGVNSYNQLATKNRLIISRFIHIICYLTQQKLPLYTDRISVGSDNFSELLCLMKHIDPVLNLLLEGSMSLSNPSPKFLIDLLESISCSLLVFIKKDLADANYITIMLEEIKSTPDMMKLASVLRYADKHGVVHERFIGFSELPKGRMIVHHVNSLLEKYSCNKKLAGISYLGPSFLDMKNHFLLDQIKLTHKEVTFVHSYSQNSLYTISTFLNYNPESRLYFSNLLAISNIFSKSPSLRLKLQEKINEDVSWNYDSNLVHTVCRYRNVIPSVLECIEEIEVWSQEIISKARVINSYMRTFDFTVLAFFFVEVFSIDVPIFALYINDVCNVDQYMKNIDRFVEGMDNLDSPFPVIWENIRLDLGLVGSSFDSLRSRFEPIFIGLKSTIVFKVRDLKFTDVGLLKFIGLLEPKHFANFAQNFPMNLLNEIKDTRFMEMFDMSKLQSELNIIYQNNSLRKCNIYEFYINLRSSGLNTILLETSKLAEFVVTLPLGPGLPDNFYSAFSRMRQYLEDPLQLGVSPCGAILTIEGGFLKKVLKDAAFENYIIEDFSRKVVGVELEYISNI